MSKPKLSIIGTKMNRLTGVREIMKDIVRALRSDPAKTWLNLSPGNPLVLPEVDAMWREYALDIVHSKEFSEIIGRYGMTQGFDPFIDAVVETYNRLYKWNIKRENVLITGGTQPLYFMAANTFGGTEPINGAMRKVVVPMVPDYTGYDGVVLNEEMIVGFKPRMEILGEHEFKYRIDFDAISIDQSSAAILCSRPCNPTGNVFTNDEMRTLASHAQKWDIPLIIDSAYAPPFPNLAFVPMELIYNDNVLHCVSLSKAGLPGERVGFAIGHERYIEALEPFFSNMGIHSSRFGQAVAAKALLSGRLAELSATVIRQFYQRKIELFREALHRHLPKEIDWYLHCCEGTLFSWLWINTAQMHDLNMYQSLKGGGLLCVPGSTFFPGLRDEYPHKHQCLRFSMTAPDEHLVLAAKVVASEIAGHSNIAR
jgi:valine--pyruvate aminotransferase